MDQYVILNKSGIVGLHNMLMCASLHCLVTTHLKTLWHQDGIIIFLVLIYSSKFQHFSTSFIVVLKRFC